ncbi:hypothetical protein ACQ7DA_10735 [Zafaria sp. J156]|uniref:hypothetical protein n=1 Tax=Zafaria sp. J156 TaxID=3116490 RepID=UPI002E769589|nr:hypothetical protein [Zafaria sp. J156]MEE1621654.1 hypothetical protein [Zafaria sp. J156]
MDEDDGGGADRARIGAPDPEGEIDDDGSGPGVDERPDGLEGAWMVPALPCGDIDEMQAFWTALGLRTTYRQLRPNPYLALNRKGLDLHYFGMPGVDPEQSYSTCIVVVPDTAPVHALFTDGLRGLYGRVPVAGVPRITRPRKRANNAGLSGFSLVDPAGNWIRFTRRPDAEHRPRAVEGRTEWVSDGGGPLARAVENAVVIADSHGDVGQALRVLSGAVGRGAEEPLADRAAAWAYLAELRVCAGDAAGAREAADEVRHLAGAADLGDRDRRTVDDAVRALDELL